MTLNDPDIVTKDFQIQKQSTPIVLNASNASESVSKSLSAETDNVRDVMNIIEDKLKLQSVDMPETEETTIKASMNGRFDSTATTAEATATTVGISILPTKATKLSMQHTSQDMLQQHTNDNIASELTELIKLEPISNTVEDIGTTASNVNQVEPQLKNKTMLIMESGTVIDGTATLANDVLVKTEQQPLTRSTFARNDDLLDTTKTTNDNLWLTMSTINDSSTTTTTTEQQPLTRSTFARNDDLLDTAKITNDNLWLTMSTINDSSTTTTTESALTTEIQNESTTTQLPVALPESLMSTTTETAIAANEIVQQATTTTLILTPTPTPTNRSILTAPITTTIPTLADLIAAAGTTIATTTTTLRHSHENTIEAASNEVQHRPTSGSEKRGKFINDNSTNAQQLNLPDTADVWTLAGMKMVPKQNQTQQLQVQQIVIAQSTNEPTINNTLTVSNNEKNLLDWTQIMLHSDLANGKKFENLLTEEKPETEAKAEAKPTITNAIDEEIALQITQKPLADNNDNINKVDESLNSLDTTTTTTTTTTTSTTAAYADTTPNPIEREQNKLQFVPVSTINPMTFKYVPDNEETLPATTTQALLPLLTTTTTTTHIPFITSTLADNDKRTTTAATLSNDNKNNFSKIAETTTTPSAITTNTNTDTIAGNSIESESTTIENNNGMQLKATALTPIIIMTTAYPEESTFPKLHANTQPQTIEQTTTIRATTTTKTAALSTQAKTDLTLSSNKTKNINTNNGDDNDDSDGGASSNVTDVTMRLEENSSEATTLSMPTASELNGTANVRDSLLTVNEIKSNENNVDTATIIATKTTTETEIKTKTKTAIKAIENLPFDLNRIATTTKETIIETTTEASKDIQNEVINLKSEETSATETLSDLTATIANKTNIATTTTRTNIPKTAITTPFLSDDNLDTTTAAAITTTTTKTINTQQSTTLKEIQEETLEKSQNQNELKEETEGILTGSNGIFNTTILPTAITATATTTAVGQDEEILNENNRAIESNAIQAFEKDKLTTTTTTTATTTTTTTASSATTTSNPITKALTPTDATAAVINRIQQNATGAKETNTLIDDERLDEEDDENVMLTKITNDMATINTTTKYTNSIIDETTTAYSTELPTTTRPTSTPTPTTTTTTPASIATKLQELYTVVTTTTTTATITTTPSTEQSNYINTTDFTDISPLTTMLPQTNNNNNTLLVTASTTVQPNILISPANVLHATITNGDTSSSMLPDNLQPNPASDATGGTDVNVIIAITVSIVGVVALILLMAFLYLMRKRQKQMSYGQRCRPVSLDAYSLDNVSVLGSVRRKGAYRASKRTYGNAAFDDPSLRHNILNASELAKFVERRSSIFEEFRDVPQIIARADEVPSGCEDKNRYANVVPLPETRVILQQQSNDEKTEYINANYVRGPRDPPNYYIACQAPLETTVADFWRMIWEQQSRVIVQATDLIENGIEKCAEYLPPSVTLDNHTTYGDFQVTLKNREVKDKYAISTIMLKHTLNEESRELTHYWYKWPETGVPNEEAPIIAMLLEARSSLKTYAIEQANELKEKSSTLTIKSLSDNNDSQLSPTPTNSLEQKDGNSMSGSTSEINGNLSADKLKATANQGPLTVHCSPGTGRTGTIIACDMAIRSLETPKRCLDIPQLVYYVRRGRASAVQTKEQYEFIYKVAHMYATKITNLSNEN